MLRTLHATKDTINVRLYHNSCRYSTRGCGNSTTIYVIFALYRIIVTKDTIIVKVCHNSHRFATQVSRENGQSGNYTNIFFSLDTMIATKDTIIARPVT